MTWETAATGKRGRQPVYSDAAIQTCLQTCLKMKVPFGLALRQTTGFVESLSRLMGLDWASTGLGLGCARLRATLCRRQRTLKVDIPYRGSPGPLHLLVDSTGIKVEGEGEWSEADQTTVWGTVFPPNAQARGVQTPRLAQDPPGDRRADLGDPGGRVHHQRHRQRAHAARAARPDPARSGDRQRHVASVTADGAFDTRKCHDAIAGRGAHAVIAPRKNAKPWKPDTAGAVARNEALRASKRLGRTIWRRWSGYHRRSRAETKMHCVKLLGVKLLGVKLLGVKLLGQRPTSRDFHRQVAELQVRVAVLNSFTAIGTPVTEAVA